MMGGKIWVESEEGNGSKFHFTLSMHKNRSVDALEEGLNSLLGNLKILLVEDNDTARQILSKILKKLGFEVIEASNGEEGLEKLIHPENRAFDILLTDWKMEKMNGIELVKAMMRQLQPSNYPNVILLTAHGTHEAEAELEGLHVDEILTKPFTISDLHNAISEIRIGKADIHPQMFNLTLSSNQFNLSGLNVLLVEDNLLNQELAVELLNNNNVSVKVAENGKIALELLEHELFDAILMDGQMPIMDGYEATQQIRKNERLKDLPIIALTAEVMPEERKKIFDVGMNDPFHKHRPTACIQYQLAFG